MSDKLNAATHPVVGERQNVSVGDQSIAEEHEILRTVVGSGVHGLAIAGTDDHDEMGVYVEPKENIYGLRNDAPHFVSRTKPEGVRSGPGDTDLVMYSLRRYMQLAAKGNPTALLPLYAPDSDVLANTVYGQSLRNERKHFLSKEAVRRFLGYMHAQHERMLGGGRQNRVPNRPELIEKFGWDVKYGSHALRLALEGWEIVSTGHLTLPMPESERQEVLAVKLGQTPREVVSDRIKGMARWTEEMLASAACPLPDQPNWDLLTELSVWIHDLYWEMES